MGIGRKGDIPEPKRAFWSACMFEIALRASHLCRGTASIFPLFYFASLDHGEVADDFPPYEAAGA